MTTAISRIAVATALAATPALAQDPVVQGDKNVPEFEPAFENQTRAPAMSSDFELDVSTLAGPLVHPWGIAVLPDDAGYLVTERPGRLRHVAPDGTLSEPLGGVPEVLNEEQGGLLDVALGPDFGESRRIFLTYAKPMGDGMSATAAASATLSEDLRQISDVQDIFVQEPPSPSPMHYGSRIVFDGEGHAFITTGEHFTEDQRVYAQDLDKTYGKIIRVNLDGSVPEGNPFVGQEGAIDSIWAYGLRNVQAAAYEDGQLWTISHGPAGGDELNEIQPGLNYGWPVIAYGENYDGTPVGSGESKMEGMEQPVYYWDPVIAPSGMVFYDGEMFSEWQGDILVGSLYPGALVRLRLEDGRVAGEERLLRDIGRVRDVEDLEDGSLLIITDEENGALLHVTRAGQSN
ncbi:PQQ-dependent sugar dehydrogenase [Roseitranquillus sediminis]|uniref:PQQ-dependent sugar dehydrogenase n=1 Tax=Roseitranquillus sediminis TaxID=2809051 RepID=UPI001D0C118D|nr:PQQ-dependent sugar dehydrogenase [Roseitranquillus sediminis]MBM9595226.1 PQQ-dependent sugar dehydrogenase [Roseitranquillus sediminis]